MSTPSCRVPRGDFHTCAHVQSPELREATQGAESTPELGRLDFSPVLHLEGSTWTWHLAALHIRGEVGKRSGHKARAFIDLVRLCLGSG